MKTIALVFSAATALMADAAFANAPGPCRDDAKKFCADVKPGGGRILKCLGEHKAELSEGCKAAGKFTKNALKSFLWMCGADAKAHCGEVLPGGGRIIMCLEKEKAKLKPRCQQHLANGKEALAKFQTDCQADIGLHCKGVKPGWGRIVGCLAEQKAKLSPTCKPHFEPDAATSNAPE